MYVSYARNAEEEEFVLLTLRGVLENEFGYKLCIFDRDSLPGGSEYEQGTSCDSRLWGNPAVLGAICCHPTAISPRASLRKGGSIRAGPGSVSAACMV